MDVGIVESIGMVASTLTTGAYLPQVYKTWRSKAVDDLSLSTCLALTTGVFLWFVYGLCLEAPALIVGNGTSLLLVGAMLRMKLKYGKAAAGSRSPEPAP